MVLARCSLIAFICRSRPGLKLGLNTVRRRGLDFFGGCACAIEIVSARIQVAKLANDFIAASWSGCGHQNYSAICARCKQSWADQHWTDEFERQRTEVDRKLDYFFFPGSLANGTFACCSVWLKTGAGEAVIRKRCSLSPVTYTTT